MAINAVNASSGTAVQAFQQRKPQETQVQKPDDSKNAEAAPKARTPTLQARDAALFDLVVNAEGQKTGQVISVTA